MHTTREKLAVEKEKYQCSGYFTDDDTVMAKSQVMSDEKYKRPRELMHGVMCEAFFEVTDPEKNRAAQDKRETPQYEREHGETEVHEVDKGLVWVYDCEEHLVEHIPSLECHKAARRSSTSRLRRETSLVVLGICPWLGDGKDRQ